MNLDKKAEIALGFDSKDLILLAIGVVGSLLLTVVFYFIFQSLIAGFVFLFFSIANTIIVIIQLKKLPDRFFAHLVEYFRSPKYYFPGVKDEKD